MMHKAYDIEGFKNEAKFTAITGGSEEVIADLAVRQAVGQVKEAQKKSKDAVMMARL